MPVDFSRQSFRLDRAPRNQKCSCGCGQSIVKDQMVYVRTQTSRGRGENRIINMEEHYRSWLEGAAKQYAAAQASSNPEFRRYLRGE